MSERALLGMGLAPDTSADAIRERAGLLDPTPEQSEAFWREHEPHMLPPDDEAQANGRLGSDSPLVSVRGGCPQEGRNGLSLK